MARGWLSQPISASSLQNSSERCSQPFRHGCLGDTRTHCTDDKGNKKLDALSKAFSLLSFIWSLWRRASLGWVCGECGSRTSSLRQKSAFASEFHAAPEHPLSPGTCHMAAPANKKHICSLSKFSFAGVLNPST